MQKKVKNNIQQRLFFKKNEKKRLVSKIITNNFQLTQLTRWQSQQKLSDQNQRSSLTRIKNRCVITGRSRSVYRLFKISRLCLRKLASKGLMPGLSKYSW